MGKEEQRRRVLLTSFGAFGMHDKNPTEAVVALLGETGVVGAELRCHGFSVAYAEVAETLPQLWDEFRPQLVVHLGVYTSHLVSVERQSFARGFCLPDIAGEVPRNNCAVAEAEDPILRTRLDVDAIIKAVHAESDYAKWGVEVEASSDPGRFLCAFSYALSLARSEAPSLFVHIPMAERRPLKSSATAVDAIIRAALAQI